MTPLLPQNDPNAESRAAALAATSAQRCYAYDRFNGVATDSQKSPLQAPEWLVRYVDKALDTMLNSKQVSARDKKDEQSFLGRLKQTLTTDLADLPETMDEIRRDREKMAARLARRCLKARYRLHL